MKIHHIGYAVKSIEKSRNTFLQMGYQDEGEITIDYARNVKILFMLNDGYRIELIEVYDAEKSSPIDSTLSKQKDMAIPYHICYEVRDIQLKIKELQKAKFVLAEPPKKAPAINNANVAFLYKRTVGLIELVEV